MRLPFLLGYAHASRLRARAFSTEARGYAAELRALLADPDESDEVQAARAWMLVGLITACRANARECRAEASAYVRAFAQATP